jgi:hypothetical protein
LAWRGTTTPFVYLCYTSLVGDGHHQKYECDTNFFVCLLVRRYRIDAYGYGYAATAPLYDYAAPAYGYGAPAQAGTTIIIVTPGAPAYTAPPVVGSGYYNYAPGYWGGYGYGWR